ncbi:MAG: M20/M25/M40 family metallo-hydrolase [Ardenticatenaceae bacterium]|nr:M20/M25/M40 family metallo-hydrolase [Ardenticatenaceae bacterium]MCB8987415.1 M20/M25/M40 family metallo-hydrolase [Ardenticatenaceae bacterium]
MRDHLKKFIWLGLIGAALLATGCGALEAPERPPLPTPVATARPFTANLEATGEMVLDPVSDVAPKVDDSIATLIEQVSQQQLMGYVQRMESFGNRNAFSDTESENWGIGATRRWIFDEFVRVGNGRLQVSYDDFPLDYNGYSAPQSNIVAKLPGTGQGNGVVVIMAHYDNRAPDIIDGESRAPGANDNGSGIALLLESARLLSAQEWKQTIIFLATSAEEEGTVGSRHFAQNAFLDSMNILAAINYDAVGGRKGIPQTVRVFAPNLPYSPSGQLARYYEYVSGLYVPTFPITVVDALDREGRWGDHREFVAVGMPAVRVIESEEDPDMVNSVRDTWNRIDYTYLQRVTQLNVAVVASIAGAPMPPPAPLVNPTDALGMYQLRWPVSEDVAGYAISFRPVGESSYSVFHLVKENQAGNVGLTGFDPAANYVVSVGALDENGRLSYFSPEIIVGPDALALSQ